MADFEISDFVECIDDQPVHPQSKTMPVLGRLYRISSIRKVGDGYSIRLDQLIPDCYRGGPCACGSCGWDSARFRKVYRPDSRNLDVLRSLLHQDDAEAV